MHVELARGLRNIAAAQFVDALDMLPPHAIRRHRIFRRLGLAAFHRKQGVDHVVGVGGFGELIDRTELHRIHSGCDVAVARKHDAAGVRPAAFQRRNHIEAVAVAEA